MQMRDSGYIGGKVLNMDLWGRRKIEATDVVHGCSKGVHAGILGMVWAQGRWSTVVSLKGSSWKKKIWGMRCRMLPEALLGSWNFGWLKGPRNIFGFSLDNSNFLKLLIRHYSKIYSVTVAIRCVSLPFFFKYAISSPPVLDIKRISMH